MTEVAQVKFMEYMSSSEIPIDLKTRELKRQVICLQHTQYMLVGQT